MGLFDKLLKSGLKAVGDAVADAVTDTLKENFDKSGQTIQAAPSKTNAAYDKRSFAQKLQAVLENIGGYEVRKNISPDELEQEAGMPIYPRGGCYAKPDSLSYALYKEGQRVAFINLWWTYESYKHVANRKIREYCDNRGIKVIDFFDYLPNEFGYMEERIRKELA